MSASGNTTTSQMPQGALALRFLERTKSELAQMWACLPDGPLVIEPPAISYIEKMSHKISSAAEAFGFPEIAVIAGAIELLSQGNLGHTVRERLELVTRLNAQMSALEVHIEYELAERTRQRVPEELPMSEFLPRFGVRK